MACQLSLHWEQVKPYYQYTVYRLLLHQKTARLCCVYKDVTGFC